MAVTNHEEQLYRIFINVNDWLKFAETKNAMLVAFNAASIYGIAQIINFDAIKNKDNLIFYLFFLMFLLAISTIVALFSFISKLDIISITSSSSQINRNLFFFQYLKSKTNIEILKEITEETDESVFTNYERDLAEQIKQNSIIASRKYAYFNLAVKLTICSYLLLLLAPIIFFYSNFKIVKI